MFDVAEPGRSKGRDPMFFEGEDWANLVRFEYDSKHERLTRHMTTFRKAGKHYRRHTETHRLQLYRRADLARLLREVGFRVRIVHGYGAYRFPWKLVGFIARKP